MGLFSRKAKTVDLVAPISGKLISLENVDDQVFSKKMMGDGFAIEPTDSKIVSPVNGKVTSIFPTKHALMIQTDDGLEIMLHLGLNTVDLNGKPFQLTVKTDDRVKTGSMLGTMDLKEIIADGKKTTVMVIISNMDDVKKISTIEETHISENQPVQTITL